MAIIINEFELIPEAPPAQAPPKPADQKQPSQRLRPEDVDQIVGHQRARLRRINAD